MRHFVDGQSVNHRGTLRADEAVVALTLRRHLPRLGAREAAVSTYPPPGPGGVGRRIEEAIELIEMELRHAIGYVNDAVVPQVRSESISAMRKLSETLRNLADKMEQTTRPPKGPGGQ